MPIYYVSVNVETSEEKNIFFFFVMRSSLRKSHKGVKCAFKIYPFCFSLYQNVFQLSIEYSSGYIQKKKYNFLLCISIKFLVINL